MKQNVLDATGNAALLDFLYAHAAREGADVEFVYRTASETLKQLRSAPAAQRKQLRSESDLQKRWYAALADGAPDYGVYDGNEYLAELWTCWMLYSRTYLRSLYHKRMPDRTSVIQDIGPVRSVLDLGCGFGYTCLALRTMFPDATVTGTNLPHTLQERIAQRIAHGYGFAVVPRPVEPAELVFASEYFEHLLDPVAALEIVLQAAKPRVLLIANTFGQRSVGHFDAHIVGGALVDGRSTTKAFHRTLVEHGYAHVKTRIFNDRPAYWKLA